MTKEFTRAELDAVKTKANAEIAKANSDLTKANSDLTKATAELNKAAAEVNKAKQESTKVTEQYTTVNTELTEARDTITKQREEIQSMDKNKKDKLLPIRVPSVYKMDGQGDFDAWLAGWVRYAKLALIPEKYKIQTLLTYLDSDIQYRFEKLDIPQDQLVHENCFENIIPKIKAIIQPQKPPTMYLAKVLQLKQRYDETVAEYSYRYLDYLGKSGASPSSMDVMIFQKGLKDKNLRQWLLQQMVKGEVTTIGEAVQMIELEVTNQCTEMLSDNEEEDVSHALAVQIDSNQNTQKQPGPTNMPDNRSCFNCGEPGHLRSMCSKPRVPYCSLCRVQNHTIDTCKKAQCNRCFRYGHLAKACMQQGGMNNQNGSYGNNNNSWRYNNNNQSQWRPNNNNTWRGYGNNNNQSQWRSNNNNTWRRNGNNNNQSQWRPNNNNTWRGNGNNNNQPKWRPDSSWRGNNQSQWQTSNNNEVAQAERQQNYSNASNWKPNPTAKGWTPNSTTYHTGPPQQQQMVAQVQEYAGSSMQNQLQEN